jgi:hypothetical protein
MNAVSSSRSLSWNTNGVDIPLTNAHTHRLWMVKHHHMTCHLSYDPNTHISPCLGSPTSQCVTCQSGLQLLDGQPLGLCDFVLVQNQLLAGGLGQENQIVIVYLLVSCGCQVPTADQHRCERCVQQHPVIHKHATIVDMSHASHRQPESIYAYPVSSCASRCAVSNDVSFKSVAPPGYTHRPNS